MLLLRVAPDTYKVWYKCMFFLLFHFGHLWEMASLADMARRP